MILDVRTTGMGSDVTPFVLGCIMLAYQRRRKVYKDFHRWLLANFGLGMGYALVDLRDLIPGFLSIIVGNILVVYCTILVYEGI